MQVLGVDEFRHVPAADDGEQSQDEARRHRARRDEVVRQAGRKSADIKAAGDHRHAGVKLAAEEQRHVIAQDVAQDAANAAGDHARDDDVDRGQTEIERDIAADDREDHEPDGVENQEDAPQPMHDAGHGDRHQRGARRDHEIFRMADPGQRVVTEEHVAHRPAAERGDGAEQADADPVHAAPARRERSRHRLRDDGDEIERVKQHGALRVR